jgi:hypothetical protein
MVQHPWPFQSSTTQEFVIPSDRYHPKLTRTEKHVVLIPNSESNPKLSAAGHVNRWPDTINIPCMHSFYDCRKRKAQKAITDDENIVVEIWGIKGQGTSPTNSGKIL